MHLINTVNFMFELNILKINFKILKYTRQRQTKYLIRCKLFKKKKNFCGLKI